MTLRFSARRRFAPTLRAQTGLSPLTIGFWLGGGLLGTGGGLLGVGLPDHHPAAVALSVLWWGIYLGCFGASIGALLGLWAEQMPSPPAPADDGAGKQ